MTDFDKKSERQSAIAAIARGELTQIQYIFRENEELESRIAELEGRGKSDSAPGHVHPRLDGIDPVEEVAFDAKLVDVRDSLIELQGRFNDLLKALKGE